MAEENAELNAIELATELTIAWLNNPNNRVNPDEVPAFLQKMHSMINDLASGSAIQEGSSEQLQTEYTPAVTARKSLASRDHIISMIDGKPYKTLRRHLSTHGLTPEQYRQRYNLKADYPMVARNYSEHRRAMAHKIGLGARGRNARSASADAAQQPAPEAKPARAPRKAAGAESAAPKPKRAPRKKANTAPTE
jgi:predicted transcriptional regulator